MRNQIKQILVLFAKAAEGKSDSEVRELAESASDAICGALKDVGDKERYLFIRKEDAIRMLENHGAFLVNCMQSMATNPFITPEDVDKMIYMADVEAKRMRDG